MISCYLTSIIISIVSRMTSDIDKLRLELLQHGFSINHPLVQGKIKIHPELQGELFFDNDSPTSLLLNEEDFQQFLPKVICMKKFYKKKKSSLLQELDSNHFPMFHSHMTQETSSSHDRMLLPITCQVLSVAQLRPPQDIQLLYTNSIPSLPRSHGLEMQDDSMRLESCLASFDYHQATSPCSFLYHDQSSISSVPVYEATSNCTCDIGNWKSIDNCKKLEIKRPRKVTKSMSNNRNSSSSSNRYSCISKQIKDFFHLV